MRSNVISILSLLIFPVVALAHTELLQIKTTQLSAEQSQVLLFFKQPLIEKMTANINTTSDVITLTIPDANTEIPELSEQSPLKLVKKIIIEKKSTALQIQILLNAASQYQLETLGDSVLINLEATQKPLDTETLPNDHKDVNDLINVDFTDTPTRSILQFIAQFSQKNILISDAVKGSLTIKLDNVTWQEAMQIILKSQALISRKMGKAIYIAPANDIAQKDKQELQVEEELRNLTPLKSKIFQIKYGKAENYYDTLRNPTNSLLSSRGKVILNNRTNMLFIEETPEKLRAIDRYIQTTDVPVRQVEIEARIVTVDKSYEQQLGIKWNVAGSKIANSNDATQTNRFNLDLIGNSSVSGFNANGLALATISNDVLIGMELAALEAEGGGEILSSPRLLTADQQEAMIQQGTEIPYRESTSSGAASITFKQAVLRLRVTPQITPNHKIMLQLQVNQDSRGEEIQGTPMINTRQISTYVLVNNGQTIVLGGIYERSKSDTTVRVPFLGSLPLIGGLFKHRAIKDERKELLIFVTPRIVKDNNTN